MRRPSGFISISFPKRSQKYKYTFDSLIRTLPLSDKKEIVCWSNKRRPKSSPITFANSAKCHCSQSQAHHTGSRCDKVHPVQQSIWSGVAESTNDRHGRHQFWFDQFAAQALAASAANHTVYQKLNATRTRQSALPIAHLTTKCPEPNLIKSPYGSSILH